MGHPRYYTSRNSFPRWRAAYGGRDARKSFATVTAGGHYVDALFINTGTSGLARVGRQSFVFSPLLVHLLAIKSRPLILFRIFLSSLINLPFRGSNLYFPSLSTFDRSKSKSIYPFRQGIQFPILFLSSFFFSNGK